MRSFDVVSCEYALINAHKLKRIFVLMKKSAWPALVLILIKLKKAILICQDNQDLSNLQQLLGDEELDENDKNTKI